MPTIGLSMIVKNGGADLRHCLESVRTLVDQIVIADTGSTDNMLEIAKEFGATIVTHPWTNHFADARNAALAPITTDWVLVLDADEELSPEALKAIPELLAQTPEQLGGYQLTIRNYLPNTLTTVLGSIARQNNDGHERARSARVYGEHILCRLFRRHPDIIFTGRIHEGVEIQIDKAGFQFIPSELRILHFGHLVDTANHDKKQERYLKMLWAAVKETPDMPHLWQQLSLTEMKMRNRDVALECAYKAVSLNPLEYGGWIFISQLLNEKRCYQEGLQALQHLPDTGDWGITKAWSSGDMLHNLERHKEARAMYVLAMERVKKSKSTFPPEFTGSVESRIGYAEVKLGMRKVGFRKLHHACEVAPMVLGNHNRLMKACVFIQDDRGAAESVETALRYMFSEKLFRRAVALRIRLREFDRAGELIETGLQLFPQSDSLLQMKAELLGMSMPVAPRLASETCV
jgi:glycosyltransferase involved in cell wall biosynthesis